MSHVPPSPIVYEARGGPVSQPVKRWIPIVGTIITFLSLGGVWGTFPPHLAKIPYLPWFVIAILMLPFLGVAIRGSGKGISLGLMAAWLWLEIPATWETVKGFGYAGISMIWLPPLTVILAIFATRELVRRSPWRALAVKAFALGMVFGSALYGVEYDSYAAGRLSPRPLAKAFLQIDKCMLQFAAAHPEQGFPVTMQQIGPGGSNCVPQELVERKYAGFTLEYSRGPRAADGYVITARVPRIGGWLSERNIVYSTDESGLVFVKFPNASGEISTEKKKLLDDGLSPPVFWNVRDCVRDTLRLWNENESTQKYISDTCLEEYDWVDGQPKQIHGDHFIYHYEPSVNNAGLLTGFTLEARPRQYGVSAIRSYLFVVSALPVPPDHPAGSYAVHATSEDRPATKADPLAMECEIAGWADCDAPAAFND